MLPLNRTKQIFASLIVLNVLLIAGFIGLHYFLGNRAKAADKLSDKIEHIRNQREQKERLENIIDSTTELRSTLDDYFVSANGSADFITLIENVAEDTRIDLKIGSVTIDSQDADNKKQATTTEVTETLVMEIRASGSWDQVVHFMRIIELLPQKTTIRNVSFSQSSDKQKVTSQRRWSVSTTIEARKLVSQEI